MGYILLRCYRGRCAAFLWPAPLPDRLARHPEKYKDLENDEKNEYWEKKQKDRQMREKKAKDKAKAMKHQRRVDKINHYRAVAGKKPLDQNLKEKK